MVKTVAFHNLGCKVNSYEMEIMVRNLTENGFLVVPFEQKADIYIVNTCSVTNIADRKSRQMIHRARSLNDKAIVIAAGCYVNTHDEADIRAEGVDICVPNNEKKNIARIINEHLLRNHSQEEAEVPDNEYQCTGTFTENLFHTRCFMKVQDGCNQFCSYCIIPYARGRITSRPVNEVCEEVKRFVEEGYNEFIITGIHLSSYGKDRTEDGEDLLGLIKKVAEVDGVRRIRTGSLEPRIITEGFVKELSSIARICPQFHLSLQSGSDTVLKRMNRHYDTKEYMAGVEILRKYFDDPALTTDIIAGFPGESEKEFEETVRFVEKVDFYETHIFKYSRRAGTVADGMTDQIEEELKRKRSGELIEIGRKHKTAYEDRYIGNKREVEILFEDIENINGKDMRVGYTKEYIKAGADPDIYAPGEISKGTLGRSETGEILFLGQMKG